MQTFHAVPFPDNEERRLATLADYALLATNSEEIFDSLTRLTAQACGTPIAFIGLIDRDRQRFIASTGMDGFTETARKAALCSHAILGDELVEVSDASVDVRFAESPLVRGYPHVRFYAAVPLIVASGDALGTLGVIDTVARSLTSEQHALLRTIAATIVEQFEIRRAREQLVQRNAADEALPTVAEGNTELLRTLTVVARKLFDALEPRVLVDALAHGVSELTGGASAQLLVRSPDGAFVATRDLAIRPAVPVVADAFLHAACAHEAIVVSDDGRRAAVQILAPSGVTAYVLEIQAADRTFTATDAAALALLGQYLAVAIRNVELLGELQARRAAVTELNQVKNDLIAMLAHDFKGPLTTIVGLADVLAEDERFDAESRQFLGMINSSAMRLASLATDTLALSRLEQNELSLRFEDVDMVALVRDIVRVFSVTRGIDMRATVDASTVRADPARLRQVFENLIGNAIKYSPRGDTVDVSVRELRGGVEVVIRDRGIGIPPTDIPKLFGRFARGSNAREMGIGGTGFGLYLSRTIVERHGGQISVESKEGKGSTFRVFIPALPATQRTRDRRILLLDNEDDGRSFVAHTLRDEGYAVYQVANESELLRALDDDRYDAAIVDVDRLIMTPVELTSRIARRTTLVRLMSNVDADPTAAANATLRKPFLIKDLKAVVEAAVADRRRGPRRGGA